LSRLGHRDELGILVHEHRFVNDRRGRNPKHP
jgi:hypothetical protein